MPPTVLDQATRWLQGVAGSANGVRALATQSDSVIASNIGQAAIHTGQLQQYPTAGTTYTTGYGLEILSAGAGSAPVIRAGIITVTVSGTPTTVVGLVFLDSSGRVVATLDASSLPLATPLGGIKFGAATLPASGATTASVTVTHGLGFAPVVFTQLDASAPEESSFPGSIGTNTFVITGFSTANITSTGTVYWLALG